MTHTETKKILAVIMISYPNYKPLDIEFAVTTWKDMLNEYSYEQVNMALKAYIQTDTSGFPPAIGQIVEKLQLFKKSDELNEFAAWQMVLKAMRNSIYHSEEEFAKLPLVVQKAVVSPGQLREWAMAEDVDGTWMSVTQSNFMRTYRAELSRKREMDKLPQEILRLMCTANEQISVAQTEQKVLSVNDERKIAQQNAVPMPGAIERTNSFVEQRRQRDLTK